MFLDYCQQLESHATWLFAAGFPLLNGGLTRIEVPRKNGLADMRLLPNAFDLARSQRGRHGETGLIKLTHRRLVNSTYFLQRGRRGMDPSQGVTFELQFCRHGKSPHNLY